MQPGSEVTEDDILHYAIYVDEYLYCDKDANTDNLRAILMDSLAFISNVSQRYIWQIDCFSLNISFDHGVWHLRGSSRVGDNIEDEWFITWILLQITSKFRNTTASVCDSDGEFLLIESSEVLPSWLKPEIAVNRVFLRHGKVHVIPIPTHPADLLHLPLNLTLMAALKIMVDSNSETDEPISTSVPATVTFNPAIHDVIAARLHDFPSKPLKMAHHMVRLRLPKSAAMLIRLCPQSVSPAVRAFYFRDPAEFKAAQKFEAFGLPSRENCRDCMVQFSRCLFAMATKQPFYPPKGVTLPHSSSSDFCAAELGLKVSIGLEILHFRQVRPPMERALFTCCSPLLLSRILGKQGSIYLKVETDVHSISPETRKQLLASSDFQIFFNRLKMRGFFDGEMEGSIRYKQLLDTSMINFVRTQASRSDDCTVSFADIVSECSLLSNSTALDNAFVPPEVPLGPDDDSSWIHVDPAELDEIMLSKSKVSVNQDKSAAIAARAAREKLEQIAAAVGSDDNCDSDSDSGSNSESEMIRAQLRSEGASKMEKIVSGVTNFVERISTLDGADTGSDALPGDNSIEFNAMLAFSRLGDAVGIEEEELFAAMERKGWGTVDELLTLKALTDMNMNSNEDIFNDSGDEDFNSDDEDNYLPAEDHESIDLLQSQHVQNVSSISELQTAMDEELMKKACDSRSSRAPQSIDSLDPESDEDGDYSSLQPVDIDSNLLKNIMESVRAQHGEAGPAGALLGLLNIAPPVEDLRETVKHP